MVIVFLEWAKEIFREKERRSEKIRMDNEMDHSHDFDRTLTILVVFY